MENSSSTGIINGIFKNTPKKLTFILLGMGPIKNTIFNYLGKRVPKIDPITPQKPYVTQSSKVRPIYLHNGSIYKK